MIRCGGLLLQLSSNNLSMMISATFIIFVLGVDLTCMIGELVLCVIDLFTCRFFIMHSIGTLFSFLGFSV